LANAALITGAAKRIGREIALALAGKGFDIALHYHDSQKEAMRLAGEIRALGRACETFQANLADMSQVARLVPAVFDALPNCNLLVNNAAVFERGRFLEAGPDNFDRHFNINLKAPFFLARDFALRCNKGHIINLLDAKIAKNAGPYFVYSMTKKSLADFTKMAAAELAPNVRVNGICPGPMLPPPGMPQEYLEKLAPLVPLGHVGNPKLIAQSVIFLVENEFITGQWLFVDGGQHL